MNDVDALKAFIDDNEDLEQLEALADRFNMFEAMGLVRQEIRHSAFLRWLLDPTETHGLGDCWLRQFLRLVIKSVEENSGDFLTLFDLDALNLGQAEVHKEWRNIDLLILDQEHRFVCVIENKVDSGEGVGQLQRYREIVEREFGDYKRAFIFLTKFGDEPSDDAYVPVGYGDLADTIENALKRRESQINDEIKLFVQQYLDMVRRHIVKESEVQELCRRLYQNHRRALDLIFENRPDRAARVSQVIQGYIESQDDLISEYFSNTRVHFIPRCMNDILPPKMLLWGLENREGRVQFRLTLCPGPQDIREQVYKMAESMPSLFDGSKAKRLSNRYHSFFSETWITQKESEELSDEQIEQRIAEKIQSFLDRKGYDIAKALKELEFAEPSKES